MSTARAPRASGRDPITRATDTGEGRRRDLTPRAPSPTLGLPDHPRCHGGTTVPFGANDWLALTQEQALEPELPICDPHHHFWDQRMARIPYQRYLLHELVTDIQSGHNVRSTVFIEARAMYRADGPEELRPVGEVEFVQGLAAASASGLYGPSRAAAAIVGHANLNLGERVAPVLETLRAASPNRFRGIRHSVTWDPHPEVETTARTRSRASSGATRFARGRGCSRGWACRSRHGSISRSCPSWRTSRGRCRISPSS